MIRVFVIAQSAETAEHIQNVLSVSPELQIVRLSFGEEVFLEYLRQSDADIVAIDASRGDAETDSITHQIMSSHPLPIVILGAVRSASGVATSIEALDAGALTVLEMPISTHSEHFRAKAEDICNSLRLMSEVKVVRRWDRARFASFGITQEPVSAADRTDHPIDIVAIGASAGGTKALQAVFRDLSEDFPVPILVVQHIAKGYVEGLVRWLSEQCSVAVQVARNGIALREGCIYLAPDDHHLTVDDSRRILLTNEESLNGFRPAIARLFSSVCDVYGSDAAAVLLSGMGTDGAAEMRRLYDAGACTIAQDKETSLIHGIPGEAIKLSAVRHILPIQEIGKILSTVTKRNTIKHVYV
jgi:two-component system chemotaxis response regulator CheB